MSTTEVPVGELVKVYRNLRRGAWSLMAAAGPRRGRVVGYSDAVELANPTFIVHEANRQRAIRERTRNVHAFVVGRVLAPGSLDQRRLTRRVRYNHRHAGYFTDEAGQGIDRGTGALLDTQGLLWIEEP